MSQSTPNKDASQGRTRREPKNFQRMTQTELGLIAGDPNQTRSVLVEILRASFNFKNGNSVRAALALNSSSTASILKAIFLTDGPVEGVLTHPRTPKSIVDKILRRLTASDLHDSFFRLVASESDSSCADERTAIRTIELLLNRPHTTKETRSKLKKSTNWIALAALSRCSHLEPQDLVDLYRGSRQLHLESSYLLDAIISHKSTSDALLLEIATNMIRESYEDSGFYYFWDIRYSRPVLSMIRSERVPKEVRGVLLQQPYLVASASRVVDEPETAWALFRSALNLGAPGNAVLRLAYNPYVRNNPALLREVVLSDEFVRRTIAEGKTFLNEKFDDWIYELLSTDVSELVRSSLASNPLSSSGALSKLVSEFPVEVRQNPAFLGEAGSILDHFSKRRPQ